MKPIKGASELIKEIFKNGFWLALCSSASRQASFLALRKLEAQEYFQIIVSGDDVQNSKPHPEPYERALEQLQIRADQALAVEDSQSGFQSAIAAKIPTIVVHQNNPYILQKRPYHSENLVRLNCLFENDNLLICFMLFV